MTLENLNFLGETLKTLRNKVLALKQESEGGLTDLLKQRKFLDEKDENLENLISEAFSKREVLEKSVCGATGLIMS